MAIFGPFRYDTRVQELPDGRGLSDPSARAVLEDRDRQLENYLSQLRASLTSRFPVVTADIADGAVTAVKLADRSVTLAKLAADSAVAVRRIYATISARDTDTTARTSAGVGPTLGELCYVANVGTVFGVANRDAEYLWTGSAWRLWEFPYSGSWPDYVPALTQTNSINYTPTTIRFKYLHGTVTCSGICAVTSAGTAGAVIRVGVPIAARSAGGLPVGSGSVYDASANIAYAGMAYLDSTTTLGIQGGSGAVNNGLGASGFTAALASGDAVTWTAFYEPAA